MKLIKNNKYKNRITAGISSLVISLGILAGCSNVKENVDSNIVNDLEIEKSYVSDDYFLNYYNISDEEITKRFNNLSIKYPNSLIINTNVGTMILKDNKGDFKILLLNFSRNEKVGFTTVRELFTDEKLFDIKTTDLGTRTDSYGKNISVNLDNITDVSKCLSDYEIYELGNISYCTNFLEAHIEDIKNKYDLDNTNYSISPNVIDYNERVFYIDKIALNYVTNVCDIFQLNVDDLKINITSDSYSIEEKFIADSMISKDEIERRYQLLGLEDESESCYLTDVATLLLKDSNGNYKVSQVYEECIKNGEYVVGYKMYDLFTRNYLCELDIRNFDFEQDYEGLYVNANLNKFSNFSEILDNYEIVEYGRWDYIYGVISNHIDEFREKDGIDYKAPHMYFVAYPNGIDYDNMYLISDIAKNYVKFLPIDMQMNELDYNIGSNDKTLIKK